MLHPRSNNRRNRSEENPAKVESEGTARAKHRQKELAKVSQAQEEREKNTGNNSIQHNKTKENKDTRKDRTMRHPQNQMLTAMPVRN